MGRIKRMFFALDRAFGGHLPPSAARKLAVRHPLPCGLAVVLERKRMIHYGFLPRPDRPDRPGRPDPSTPTS
ncbi:hypothetical protein [Streptomyces hokutonensis]|uniref:hypothetical protein n=1 Tax=Streptomyces hokutonensis TaxID=1306990 RepID=UPI0003789E90|nr:hypothetical protein [Streptomyces hokutonensis]